MTMDVKTNGHTTYPLPIVDWLKDLGNQAWTNALVRRKNRPTMPNTYHPNKAQRTIQQAYEDALYLASLWIGGVSISKRQTTDAGLTVARWYYARALLDMARLLEGRKRHRLTTTDEAVLRNRLETAFGRARAQPELFFARVPRWLTGR
jgi:hypothetical protein